MNFAIIALSFPQLTSLGKGFNGVLFMIKNYVLFCFCPSKQFTLGVKILGCTATAPLTSYDGRQGSGYWLGS